MLQNLRRRIAKLSCPNAIHRINKIKNRIRVGAHDPITDPSLSRLVSNIGFVIMMSGGGYLSLYDGWSIFWIRKRVTKSKNEKEYL